MILVLDTETTGLPANYKAPVSDLENWPRAVQIAWATYKNDGTPVSNFNYIIRPDGYEIPAEATAKHGITTEHALVVGRPLAEVLASLKSDIQVAELVVAHNIDFDAAILGAEFIRAEFGNPIEFASMICTMRTSTDYCAIPGPYGNKWPKLSELHCALFGTAIDGEHDAAVDVAACAKCFFELVQRGVIELNVKPEPDAEPDVTVEEFEASEAADALTEQIALYNPIQLQASILRAYREQDQTRMTLFHTDQALWEAQRELEAANYDIRQSEGFAVCKNETQRSDYLYGKNQQETNVVGIARLDALGARLDFERAHDAVERVRALLRVAELAAKIEKGE